MAMKSVTKAAQKPKKDHVALEQLAALAWHQAHQATQDLRQLAAQFRAIHQELGMRGNASKLAISGQQLAQSMESNFEVACKNISDGLHSAGSKVG